MAGRNDVDFRGVHADYTSYKADGVDIVYDPLQPGGSAAVGKAVMVSGHKTVRLTGDGARVKGKLLKVEQDGVCNIQDEGYGDLPAGDGAAVTPGRPFVGALGAGAARGFIREVPAAGGAYAQAVANDTQNGRGEIIDSATPAKTMVNFG